MSFLDAFDVNESDMKLVDEALRQSPRRNDKRICICGHSVSRHDDTTKLCRPSRFDCPCKRLHPVIEVPDTRYFLSRTLGSGEKHALTRGIYLARQAQTEEFDERAKWLIDMVCENPSCGAETKLFPVMCDSEGFRLYDSDDDAGVTAFYCENCREVYHDDDTAVQAKREALRTKNS